MTMELSPTLEHEIQAGTYTFDGNDEWLSGIDRESGLVGPGPTNGTIVG